MKMTSFVLVRRQDLVVTVLYHKFDKHSPMDIGFIQSNLQSGHYNNAAIQASRLDLSLVLCHLGRFVLSMLPFTSFSSLKFLYPASFTRQMRAGEDHRLRTTA